MTKFIQQFLRKTKTSFKETLATLNSMASDSRLETIQREITAQVNAISSESRIPAETFCQNCVVKS